MYEMTHIEATKVMVGERGRVMYLVLEIYVLDKMILKNARFR